MGAFTAGYHRQHSECYLADPISGFGVGWKGYATSVDRGLGLGSSDLLTRIFPSGFALAAHVISRREIPLHRPVAMRRHGLCW